MPELALDDVEWHVPHTVRHLYERAELRIWGWLPGRVRLRLTTYGLAEASRYLSLEWHEQWSRSVRELREAIAQAAREAEAGPRRQGRWTREPRSPAQQARDRSH